MQFTGNKRQEGGGLLHTLTLLHRSLNRQVMLLDDDEVFLEGLQAVLKEDNYEVLPATTYSRLREHLSYFRPSAILIDLHLDGEDGLAIAQRLKRNPQTREIPVIMVSGDREIARKAKEAEVDYYLKKPFSMDELMACLKQFKHYT